jgi:hypothetical protein
VRGDLAGHRHHQAFRGPGGREPARRRGAHHRPQPPGTDEREAAGAADLERAADALRACSADLARARAHRGCALAHHRHEGRGHHDARPARADARAGGRETGDRAAPSAQSQSRCGRVSKRRHPRPVRSRAPLRRSEPPGHA